MPSVTKSPVSPVPNPAGAARPSGGDLQSGENKVGQSQSPRLPVVRPSAQNTPPKGASIGRPSSPRENPHAVPAGVAGGQEEALEPGVGHSKPDDRNILQNLQDKLRSRTYSPQDVESMFANAPIGELDGYIQSCKQDPTQKDILCLLTYVWAARAVPRLDGQISTPEALLAFQLAVSTAAQCFVNYEALCKTLGSKSNRSSLRSALLETLPKELKLYQYGRVRKEGVALLERFFSRMTDETCSKLKQAFVELRFQQGVKAIEEEEAGRPREIKPHSSKRDSKNPAPPSPERNADDQEVIAPSSPEPLRLDFGTTVVSPDRARPEYEGIDIDARNSGESTPGLQVASPQRVFISPSTREDWDALVAKLDSLERIQNAGSFVGAMTNCATEAKRIRNSHNGAWPPADGREPETISGEIAKNPFVEIH